MKLLEPMARMVPQPWMQALPMLGRGRAPMAGTISREQQRMSARLHHGVEWLGWGRGLSAAAIALSPRH